MTTRITGREWEDLSAYLDGQLSSKESTRLEDKLRERADLRHALDELSQTRSLLRSQPVLRAPRNFLLTPKMVGERRAPARRFELFPLMRLASGLAVALFILVLAGDFLMSGRQPSSLPVALRAAQIPAPAAELKSAPEAYAPLAESVMEEPAATEAPAELQLELQAAAPASSQVVETNVVQAESQPVGKMAESTAASPAPTLGAAALQDGGAGAYPYPPPSESIAASAADIDQATATPLPPDQETPPREQANMVDQRTVEDTSSGPTAWPGWRFLEISLAFLVLITAGWAIYIRRSRRM